MGWFANAESENWNASIVWFYYPYGVTVEDLSSHGLIIVGEKKKDGFLYRILYLSSQSPFHISQLGSEKFGDKLNATGFHLCLEYPRTLTPWHLETWHMLVLNTDTIWATSQAWWNLLMDSNLVAKGGKPYDVLPFIFERKYGYSAGVW